MLIELEYKNSLLESITSEELAHEIIVGRGSQCEWRIPQDDGVISNQHVKIIKKGRAVWIEDLDSTNGMYLKDKRIQRRKLGVGDQITMGDCVITVSAPRSSGLDGPSSVVVLSGLKKRQKMVLESPALTIGSGPKNGLVFPSDLVSREHSVIHVRDDGSCWIEDLGSKNGTMVNDVSLPRNKERLLKEGDRIAISQFELLFQDGAVARKSSQVWLKVGVLVATLIIAAAAYQGYQRMKPSAGHHIKVSRELARQELFNEAESALSQAEISRGHKQAELEISMLRRSILEWDATRANWKKASASLGKGDWVEASRQLAALQSATKEAWTWNEQSPALKEDAGLAKNLLDALLRAKAAKERTDLNMTELAEVEKEAARQMARLPQTPPTHLAALREALIKVQVEIGGLLSHNRTLEQAVALLDSDTPSFSQILTDLRKVKQEASGAVRHKAEQFIEPVTALSISYTRLVEAVQHTRNLDFDRVKKQSLELPSVDACSIDPHISQSRIRIENMNGNLELAVMQLEGLHQRLAPYLSDGQTLPEPVRLLGDPSVMAKVLACDALERAMPRRSREVAESDYDRVLGVEEFYTVMRVFPMEPDSMLLQHMPFVPALRQAKQFCKEVSLFNSFINEPHNRWLIAGKMKTFLASINRVNDERERLISHWLKQAEGRTGREAVILGGMAHILAEDPAAYTLAGQPLSDWTLQQYKALKIDVLELGRKHSTSPPAQQIGLRQQILDLGLPGDPTVRKMWSSRDASMAVQ